MIPSPALQERLGARRGALSFLNEILPFHLSCWTLKRQKKQVVGMIPSPAFGPIPSPVCRPAGSISAFGGETGDGTKGQSSKINDLPAADRQVVG